MAQELKELSAFILAGGKSRRLGYDKALVEIDGKPLIELALELIGDLFAETAILAGDAEAYGRFDVPVIADRYREVGPLAAIEAGLRHSKSETAFFFAVDMPAINFDFVRKLYYEATDADAAMFRDERGLQPLAAFYSKKILPIINEMIERGEHSLVQLAEAAGAVIVDYPGPIDDLVNINTEQQLRNAISILANRQG